jgi:transposase
METMGQKSPRPRRSFSDEFETEVVELVRQPDRNVHCVARGLNLIERAARDAQAGQTTSAPDAPGPGAGPRGP